MLDIKADKNVAVTAGYRMTIHNIPFYGKGFP
jgi:hypothetical protein